jgi:hypothetical protein
MGKVGNHGDFGKDAAYKGRTQRAYPSGFTKP